MWFESIPVKRSARHSSLDISCVSHLMPGGGESLQESQRFPSSSHVNRLFCAFSVRSDKFLYSFLTSAMLNIPLNLIHD